MDYNLNEGVLTIELPRKIYIDNIEQINAEFMSIPLPDDLSEIELAQYELALKVCFLSLKNLLANSGI